jgi:hypothetical protein
VRDGLVEVLPLRLLAQERKEGGERLLHAADEAEVEPTAATEVLRQDVDLRDDRILRIELGVREVASEHEQRVAGHHGVVARGETEQPRHAHVERVVVLDVLLAAQRVDDGSLERGRREHELVVCARAARSGEDGDPFGPVEESGQLRELDVRWAHRGRGARRERPRLRRFLKGDVAGNRDDGDPAFSHGAADRQLEHARHLVRVVDRLAVVAAVLEEDVRASLLKVVAPALAAGNLRGDGQNGDAAPVAVVEPVDEVHVAGAAASGAHGERAREVRLRPGREGRHLLVAYADPFDAVLFAQALGDAVERVAHHAVDAADACRRECFDHELRYVRPCHTRPLFRMLRRP